MSIQFYNNNFSSKEYSTRPDLNLNSRTVKKNTQQKPQKGSGTKAYNLNDEQRRLKRQYSSLYKQSTQQSGIFEKGVKKINNKTTNQDQSNHEKSIKRTYHNSQSYNLLNPSSMIETKFNPGGVKKIYLYDQNKQSKSISTNSESRKKFIKNFNTQSQVKNDNLYLVKKLPTHKNAANQWYNQTTTIQFSKKQNTVNKQNWGNQKIEVKKKNFRQNNMNIKNKSQVVAKQAGITISQDAKNKEALDFKQDYYTRANRGEKIMSKIYSGFLSYRQR